MPNSFKAISLLLLIAGCAPSYGTKVDDSKLASFQAGKTTASDVTAALGPPSNVDTKSTGEKRFTYAHMEGSPRASTFIPLVGPFVGGADIKTHSVSFDFDPQGILKDWSTNDSQACSGTGIYSDVTAANCEKH